MKLTINRANHGILGRHGDFQRSYQGLVCLDASRRILRLKFSILSRRDSCVCCSHYRHYVIL